MRVYRIERKKHLKTTLKGIGASLTEGSRWNSLNTYLVYTADSRALATLEISVHLDLSEDLPNDRYYVEIDVPDDLEILELKREDLPDNWNAKPPITDTQQVGDNFVRKNRTAILKVPSSIVPPEFNYLINPNHSEAKRITVISTELLKFDKRLKSTD